MIRFLYITLVALLALSFTSCGGGGGSSGGKHVVSPATDGPAIMISALGDHSLSKMVVGEVVVCPSFVNSCLGTLFMGQSFEFLVENTSDDPLDSVSFASSDTTAWSTNPTYIPVLQVPGAGGFLPILRLNVAHGTSTSMLGSFPQLWDGLDTSKVMVFDTIVLGYTQAGERKTQQFIVGVLVKTARLQFTSEAQDTVVVVGNCAVTYYHPGPDGRVTGALQPGDRIARDSSYWQFTSPCSNRYNTNGEDGIASSFSVDFALPVTDL